MRQQFGFALAAVVLTMVGTANAGLKSLIYSGDNYGMYDQK